MVDSDDVHECPNCRSAMGKDSDFCPDCGELLLDQVMCHHHGNHPARGACIICSVPFCEECINKVNGRYLCSEHKGYEIYQGMARVFGESDASNVEYAKSCLEMAGLHPFVFSRKASPLSLGGPDYTLFRASGEYIGHIINEYKLMVPCSEALQAEHILHDLEMLHHRGKLF